MVITSNIKVKEIKTKIYQLNNIFTWSSPYLRDMINDHKAHGKLKVHSSNEVTGYETEGEQKIQLSMDINFVFLKILMKFVQYIQKVII